MKKNKRASLEKAGWKVGSAGEFLDLTPEQEAYIELKLALAAYLKNRRESKKLTQNQLARFLHSSQSRIAKMEAGDPSVSLDLLFRSLLLMGTSPKQIARVINSLSLHTA